MSSYQFFVTSGEAHPREVNVQFQSALEITLESIKKAILKELDIPGLSKDFNISVLNDKGVYILLQNERDLKLVTDKASLRLEKKLSKDGGKEKKRQDYLEKKEQKHSEERIKQLNDKADARLVMKQQLQVEWKDKYSAGGTVTSSTGEEWMYEPQGTTISNEQIDGMRIIYEWDGEIFQAAENHPSLGAGLWDSHTLCWFAPGKEHNAVKIEGKKNVLFSYIWDEEGRKYKPESRTSGLTTLVSWKWGSSWLKSETSGSEWMVQGQIPPPVVMFLQMMSYCREYLGSKQQQQQQPQQQLKDGDQSPSPNNNNNFLNLPANSLLRKDSSSPESPEGASILMGSFDYQKNLRRSRSDLTWMKGSDPNNNALIEDSDDPENNNNNNVRNPSPSASPNNRPSKLTFALTPFAKEGYCEVKGGHFKNWKKRWVVVKDHGADLLCYANQEDTTSDPYVISLYESYCSTRMKNDKYCILIKRQVGSHPELHQLLVDSRAERDAWIAAFLSHGSSKDGVIKEGELKSRERYWFVLQRDGLAYYAKQEDVIKAKPPKGEIELTINTTVRETNLVIGSLGRKAKFGFGIFQPSGRKYYLFADSMQELKEWMSAINEAIEESKKRKAKQRKPEEDLKKSTWEIDEEDLLDTSDCPFDEPDSPDNIVYFDFKKMEPSTEYRPGDPPLIKGATLTKLLEKATPTEYADPNYLSDFLLTFKSFTSPRELLNLLIKRFLMPKPKQKLSDEEMQAFDSRKKVIHLRVINFIRLWVEMFWEDFIEDKDLAEKLDDFIGESISKVSAGPAEQLKRLLQKKKSGLREDIEENTKKRPVPILPKVPARSGSHSSDALGLMDLSSEELARQITLIDFEYFRKIKTSDLFNKNWLKKDKELLSPNLMAFIKRFNELTKWIATEIVFVDDLKQRATVLSKWIEIGEKCVQLHNFSAVMAIVSALQTAAVFRLKQTWALLTASQREAFEHQKALLTREGNFKEFRKHLTILEPPCIPYIGMYLTDLTFIEDGNQNFLKGGLINFSKRRKLAKVLKEIHQYQQEFYNLQPVPFIQDFILNGVGLEEKECYALSQGLEGEGTQGNNLKRDPSITESLKEKRKNSLQARRGNNPLPIDDVVFSRTDSESSTISTASTKESEESRRQRKARELHTKFYLAVSEGDIERVQSLILQGVSLKGNRESHSQTPLHVAAYEGHESLVSFFLSIKDEEIGRPDINAKDKAGWTALHCAASPGHLQICQILLRAGADPNIPNNDGNIPLHLLSRRNPEHHHPANKKKPKTQLNSKNLEETLYAKVIRLMVEKGSDVNSRNEVGDTPLHQAAASGNEDAIRLLLKRGAKISIQNKDEDIPLTVAEKASQKGAAQILREAENQKKEGKKSLVKFGDVKVEDTYRVVGLMKDPEIGLQLKDHKHILITYKKCFMGENAVDWMLQNLPVRSREDAAKLIQKLMDAHFIQRVGGKGVRPFKEKEYYRFCESESDFQQISAKIASLRDSVDVINFDSFELLRVIGEGNFGRIFLARKKDTKRVFAIKSIDKQQMMAEGELSTLLSEKQILQNDSPFLVHLHSVFQNNQYVFIVMDFIPGGDLGFLLKREERLGEMKAQFVAAELVLAIEYLHSRGVVYRDLRPDNILIDSEGHICLTDFGLSKLISDDSLYMQTACGTPSYSAPEVLEGESYNKSIDWWSFGVVLYQMLLGFTPFEWDGNDFGQLIRNIISSRILYPEEYVSHNARSLLEALLQRNPKQRLQSIDEIKHHPFFHGIDWNALMLKKTHSPFRIELKSDDDVGNFDWKFTSQPLEMDELIRGDSKNLHVEGLEPDNNNNNNNSKK